MIESNRLSVIRLAKNSEIKICCAVFQVYKKDVHPKFPLGGKMSQYLDSLSIGDSIDVRGPSGRLKYLGKGKFSMKFLRKDPADDVIVRKVSMIAGITYPFSVDWLSEEDIEVVPDHGSPCFLWCT